MLGPKSDYTQNPPRSRGGFCAAVAFSTHSCKSNFGPLHETDDVLHAHRERSSSTQSAGFVPGTDDVRAAGLSMPRIANECGSGVATTPRSAQARSRNLQTLEIRRGLPGGFGEHQPKLKKDTLN